MQKITPFLWFNNNAEEAVNYYTSLFKNSRIGLITRYGDEGHGINGSIRTISFTMDGQEFMALNGGPVFSFSQAISFLVNCDSQEEIDRLWDKLSEGGQKQVCGWLVDKFGITWQIAPSSLGEMMKSDSCEKQQRLINALLQMEKLDADILKQAFEGL